MKRSEASSIVSVLVAAFPRMTVSQATLNVYVSELLDLDAAEATAAVHRLIRTSAFLPTVADVRKEVARAQEGIDAGEAYATAVKAVRRLGFYRETEARESLPPAVWRGIESLGGWAYLCHSENQMADRAHFLRCYGEWREREQRELQLGSVSTRLLQAPRPAVMGLIEGVAAATKRVAR